MARLRILAVTIVVGGLFLLSLSEARILKKCEAVKELLRGGVSRTFLTSFLCIMQNDGHMDTALKTGPGTAASFSHGVFQINSQHWCVRGRPGGKCQKKCEDFLDDDIQDDIVCAQKIAEAEGFQHWKGWVKKCKGKDKLPTIGDCSLVGRRSIGAEIEEQDESDVPEE